MSNGERLSIEKINNIIREGQNAENKDNFDGNYNWSEIGREADVNYIPFLIATGHYYFCPIAERLLQAFYGIVSSSWTCCMLRKCIVRLGDGKL